MLGGMTAITLQPVHAAAAGDPAARSSSRCSSARLIEMVFIRWLDNALGAADDHHHHRRLDRDPRSRAAHLGREASRAAVFHRQLGDRHHPAAAPTSRRRCSGCSASAAVTVAALTLFFRYTPLGRQMRACAANRDAARLCGINDRQHGHALVRAQRRHRGAGRLRGLADHLRPVRQRHRAGDQGLHRRPSSADSATAWPRSAAGLILGCSSRSASGSLPAAYKDAVAIVVLLVILFVRPSGIFGSAEAAPAEGVLMGRGDTSPSAAFGGLVVAHPARCRSRPAPVYLPDAADHVGLLCAGRDRPVPADGLRRPGLAGPRRASSPSAATSRRS